MRKVHIVLIFFTLFLVGCGQKQVVTDWPEVTNEAKPWTRWWWMGSDVDSAGLTYNLEAMAQAGIGGVEITPIYGVKGREDHYIDYLSPEWMRMLSFTESEANRLGMGVDMNMGTGWPFGGPEISIEDAATKAIFQEYTLKGGSNLNDAIVVNDEKQKDIAYLASLMAYSLNGEKFDLTDKIDDSGMLQWQSPTGDNWKLIALFIGKTLQQVKRAAPGGQGYVLDHFNAEAVQRYFGKFDKAFRTNKVPFPHSFFNDSYEVYNADWTPELLAEFEKRRGYKLQEFFPELLADGATDISVRVISDYRETIGELLQENFTQAWTAWAHKRNTKTKNQAHGSPANLIDLYASVDVPECETFGITDFDIPLLRKDSIRKENDGDPTTLKYASSAAHITGKKYTSAETFTWLTEHFRTSLSQCKPEIDQMFTSGVNRVYFHGSTYSPENAAWPGWKFYASVDMSPTNSIWKDASIFFDYIARVQSFLQEGKPDNDFLLYLPIYDIWEEQRGDYYTAFAIHGMRERLPKFYNSVGDIRKLGYDLDYISDRFIQATQVENGLLKTEGGTLYKALILPSSKIIPLETLQQIKSLAENGATIIFTDQYPVDVPGLADLENRRVQFVDLIKSFPTVKSFDGVAVNKFGKGKIVTGNNYEKIFSALDVRNESFVTDFGGQLIRKKNDTGYHYFMTMLQNKEVNGWLPLAVNARSAMFFDPMTGRKGKAALRQVDGATQVYMQLKSGESIILKTVDEVDISAVNWSYFAPNEKQIELKDGWKMSFLKSEPEINEVFKLDSLGSWTELGNNDLRKNMGTASYRNTFHLEKKDGVEYQLNLGDVRESARVKINGKDAGTLISVPFEMNVGSFLLDGENTIEVEVTNLPANRIADFDKRGVEWRIFHEINFVSITYQPTKFDVWDPVPSGLLGPVTIKELKEIKP